jgi:hypothetical protein
MNWQDEEFYLLASKLFASLSSSASLSAQNAVFMVWGFRWTMNDCGWFFK